MKVAVCVKVISGALNPFDECALENALRISDDVTVVSMSPTSALNVLKPLTRLGVKVILLSDSAYAGSDTLATGYVLSCALRKIGFDLVICGRQSTDGDTAQVGPMISAMLGVDLLTNVLSFEITGGSVKAITRFGNEQANMPALLTLERNCVLRFPSIFSQEGDVTVFDNAVIGCDKSRCGLSGSPTRVLATFEGERGKRNCRFIERSELLSLIERLKNERRIVPATETELQKKKLDSAWAIGGKAAKSAEKIAEKVNVINESNPLILARLIEKEKPHTVIWNADLMGRRNAPVCAALLKTGLCADCTLLETDGEELYMYRPAREGNITAKIKCLTKPRMATVRSETSGGGIIVAGGTGVTADFSRLREFAQKIGAEVGASRGAVDAGAAKYEEQIGLTGCSVSPDIYVAIGISGAVQHTCAVENSGYIIAINPDRDARIFDYSDYGIISEF